MRNVCFRVTLYAEANCQRAAHVPHYYLSAGPFQFAQPWICQGVLQRERYAATHSASTPFISGNGLANWWNNSGSDGGAPTLDDAAGLALLAGVTATIPLWLPYLLFDGGYDTPGCFPEYPYARPEAGAIAVGWEYDRRPDDAPFLGPRLWF